MECNGITLPLNFNSEINSDDILKNVKNNFISKVRSTYSLDYCNNLSEYDSKSSLNIAPSLEQRANYNNLKFESCDESNNWKLIDADDLDNGTSQIIMSFQSNPEDCNKRNEF